MIVTFKDSMTFLNNDVDPTVGVLSYDNSELLNANTPVTIKTKSKTITVLAKQIKLSIFKLDSKQFGFIFKSVIYHSDVKRKEDFIAWNRSTKRLLGRELDPCFLEVTNDVKRSLLSKRS